MMLPGWYEQERDRIENISDPRDRIRAREKLDRRLAQHQQREILASLESAAERLGQVAAALESAQDSGRQTREEMAALRTQLATVADLLSESSDELPAERRGVASLWSVVADRPLVVVVVVLAALVVVLVGRGIVSPWLSVPASSPQSSPPALSSPSP